MPRTSWRSMLVIGKSERGYKYKPLPSPKGYIRLISLLPRADNGEIRISLQVAKLEDVGGTFNALSYVWGPEGGEKRLSIGKKYAVLRPNLWDVLDHFYTLQQHDVGSLFWVDALCINQSDLIERGEQVEQMKQIYSSARRVLIWLGFNSKAGIHVDMEPLKHIYHSTSSYQEAMVLVNKWLHDKDQEEQDAVVSIAGNEFWSRVWVTQEIVVVRDAKVILGSAPMPLLPFFYLGHAIESLFASGATITTGWGEHVRPRCARMYRITMGSTLKPFSALPLLGAISRFHNGECYDRRDQIYGMLGVAKKGDQFPVSYEITTSQLFWRLLEFWHERVYFNYLWTLFSALNLRPDDVLPTRDHLMRALEPWLLLSASTNKKVFINPGKQGLLTYTIQLLVDQDAVDESEFGKDTPFDKPLPPYAHHLPIFYCRYSQNIRHTPQEYLCVSFMDGFADWEPSNSRYQPALLIDPSPGVASGRSFLLGCFIYPDLETEPLVYMEDPQKSFNIEEIAEKRRGRVYLSMVRS